MCLCVDININMIYPVCVFADTLEITFTYIKYEYII